MSRYVDYDAIDYRNDKMHGKSSDTCRYYNSNIPCGSTPSVCKEADKFAEEFVDGLKKLKQTVPTISKMEQVDEPSGDNLSPVEDEQQITMDCSKCERYKDGGELCDFCAIKDEPQTERRGE